MNDFDLSDADKVQSLWLRLKDHFLDRLDDLRKRNDAPRSEQDTAELRGQIRCLKQIIALGDDRPVTGDEDAP